jgi:hypothetical protein
LSLGGDHIIGEATDCSAMSAGTCAGVGSGSDVVTDMC